MAEHYTRNTISVQAWCKPCGKFTTHNVMGGRKAGCQACIDRLAAAPKQAPPAKQERLF